MLAQARVSYPNSTALVAATDTTRSLNENDGLTLSFLMYRLLSPSFLAEVPGLHQRCVARHDVHRVVGRRRQQILVAPDAQRPLGDASRG